MQWVCEQQSNMERTAVSSIYARSQTLTAVDRGLGSLVRRHHHVEGAGRRANVSGRHCGRGHACRAGTDDANHLAPAVFRLHTAIKSTGMRTNLQPHV